MKQVTDIKEILNNASTTGGMLSDNEIQQINEIIDDIQDEYNNEDGCVIDLKLELDDLKEKSKENIAKVDELESEMEMLKADNAIFPRGTFDCSQKNKILQNLHANCTEEQLRNLEEVAKKSIQQKGILYKEVLT